MQVTLKLGTQTRTVAIDEACDDPISECAKSVRIPPSKISMIAKGGRSIRTRTDFFDAVAKSSGPVVFLCVGTPEEDDTGCDPRDIEVLVRQCNVDRNAAIRALNRNSHDLINAILDVSNND